MFWSWALILRKNETFYFDFVNLRPYKEWNKRHFGRELSHKSFSSTNNRVIITRFWFRAFSLRNNVTLYFDFFECTDLNRVKNICYFEKKWVKNYFREQSYWVIITIFRFSEACPYRGWKNKNFGQEIRSKIIFEYQFKGSLLQDLN